jgi:hypothetical protein
VIHALHVMGSCTQAHHAPAQVLCVTGRACGPSQSIIYIQHTSTMYIERALAASMPLVLPRNQAFAQPLRLWLLHPSAFTSVQTNGCPHRLTVKQLRPSALWLLASHQSFTSRCAAHGLSVFHLTGVWVQPSYYIKEFFKECHLGDALAECNTVTLEGFLYVN